MSPVAALWLSLLLLLGNAFFVGAEFAVMAARRSPARADGGRRQRPGPGRLEALEQLGSMLACAQLGITRLLGGPRRRRRGGAARDARGPVLHGCGPVRGARAPDRAGVALLVVVYLHVVIGEMVPKNLAIAGPDRAALLLAPPLLFVSRALRPLIRVMEWIAKGLVRACSASSPRTRSRPRSPPRRSQHIVAESHREGLLEERRSRGW